MGTTLKNKLELVLSEAEAGEFFARLGRGLSEGRLEEGGLNVPLDVFKNMTLGLKRSGDGFLVKLKVKYNALPDEVEPEDDLDASLAEDEQEDEREEAAEQAARRSVSQTSASGRPKYKSLKKRMDKDFKVLVEAARAGNLPATALVQRFAADSRLMCTYPGKGDPFYPAYEKAVEDFEAAVATGDADRFRETVDALAGLKKDCHSKYK